MWCHHFWWNWLLSKSEFWGLMLVSSWYFVWHHLWLISHLLPIYRLKFTFTRLLTDCLMSWQKWWNKQKVNIFSKFTLQIFNFKNYVINNTKFIFKFILCVSSLLQIDLILKNKKGCSSWLSTQPIWPRKKANFDRVLKLTSLKFWHGP